ncbi:MAK10-like protein, partial [Tanacetum coccineum]
KSQGASTLAKVQRMQRVIFASAVGSIMYDVRCTRPDVAFAQDITSRFQQTPYVDDDKSQSGYVFNLNGDVAKEAVWIRKFIFGLGIVPTNEEPMNMYCDSTGAITIANEPGITKVKCSISASTRAMKATETPLKSPTGMIWHLFDPTPSGWTSKLRNDILMFQQRQGESLSEAWTRFKDLLQKVPHHGIDLWLQIQIFYDHANPITRRTINQSAGGKLRDKNDKESWALLEDLALYDNESWNDPRDFAKLVKAISMPHDVTITSDHHLIELENQFQRMMEAHLTQIKLAQVNKITSSCEIYSGPRDTQYCMEDPE